MGRKKKAVLSEEAHEALLEYRRKWYRKNRDKQKVYTARYWEKKAREAAEAEKNEGGQV